jgi:hypothetical protein
VVHPELIIFGSKEDRNAEEELQAGKRSSPTLRQVDVLTSQGQAVAEAIPSLLNQLVV